MTSLQRKRSVLDLNRLLQTGHCHRCSIAVIHRVHSIGSGRSTAAINFFVWPSLVQRVRSSRSAAELTVSAPFRSFRTLGDCGTNDWSQGTADIAGRRRAAKLLRHGRSIAADAIRSRRPIECPLVKGSNWNCRSKGDTYLPMKQTVDGRSQDSLYGCDHQGLAISASALRKFFAHPFK